jgi:hypothetical protein
MEQYIPKSAVVAEIESRLREIKCITELKDGDFGEGYLIGKESAYKVILSFLDTLEVKEQLTWKDIRLISEVGEDFMNSEESDNLSEEEYYTEILNRFKAQKGEEV